MYVTFVVIFVNQPLGGILIYYGASFIEIPYYEVLDFIIWDSYKGCTVRSSYMTSNIYA